MLAEYLVGRIALEALRARIPAGDMPAVVEQVDGVVLDRLDEQLEAAVTADHA